jgi:hypothetical protein
MTEEVALLGNDTMAQDLFQELARLL